MNPSKISISDIVWTFKREHTLSLSREEVIEMDADTFRMLMLNYDSNDVDSSPFSDHIFFRPLYILGIFDAN